MATPFSIFLLIPFFFIASVYSLDDNKYPPESYDYNLLTDEFYDMSCPHLHDIVRYHVWSAIQNDTRIAASLLRLEFHDCIVNGCDASVLLDDTKDLIGEKGAGGNKNSLRGFEVIDAIKADVERYCPYTVSCADILTLAARDSVYLVGGPFWNVPLGRRDGLTASIKAANEQLPSPIEPLPKIVAKFTSKGLDLKDVAVLSGAHTIGFARCFTFKRRLFNYRGSGQADPEIGVSMLSTLQRMCDKTDVATNANLAPLDVASTYIFDNEYYTNLMTSTGLLESDQALIADPETAPFVKAYSNDPYLFANDFAESMVRLSFVGVLTGQEGQIRRECRAVNYNYY